MSFVSSLPLGIIFVFSSALFLTQECSAFGSAFFMNTGPANSDGTLSKPLDVFNTTTSSDTATTGDIGSQPRKQVIPGRMKAVLDFANVLNLLPPADGDYADRKVTNGSNPVGPMVYVFSAQGDGRSPLSLPRYRPVTRPIQEIIKNYNGDFAAKTYSINSQLPSLLLPFMPPTSSDSFEKPIAIAHSNLNGLFMPLSVQTWRARNPRVGK